MAFDTLFNTMIDSVDFSILMFVILLGMVVMLMQESGGTRAYGEWAAKKLKEQARHARGDLAAGCADFCGRLLNCLTVGSVMRPVTDKYKVSRASWPTSSTLRRPRSASLRRSRPGRRRSTPTSRRAAPMSGFEMFVRTILFNLYAMLTLYMVFFLPRWWASTSA